MTETTLQETPRPVYRKDYEEPDYWIDRVDLRFELNEESSLVHARLELRRNDAAAADAPLVLDGEALETIVLKLDGRELGSGDYEESTEELKIPGVPATFVLETTVRCKPQDNTELSGLYKSSGNYCTQCEALGFRRITWFLDRPDVMARYTTYIEADKALYPVLLSNGNRTEVGDLEGGRHWVKWEDPFPKPSYLFALVAGNLACKGGSFTTASGREVRLEVWVEPHEIDKTEHALRSLEKSMVWDEQTFGLEYDLDIYMIVAVGDFNMGAMENKGLNIFNSKFVLASTATATDDDYEHIEGVIAHEYFHNWTGNRVTCRDWFQLTLKEGLTVFRDQQFTADATSYPVKRILDVCGLRVAQFAEDAGPMAHPIRPESYISMDNFYTSTVYEKGATVIRMMHTLLGAEAFRKGMDLYFERHDGQAVTCDDFRAAMATAGNLDLEQFERWYLQPGTPTLKARGDYDAQAQTYTLHLSQSRGDVPTGEAFQPTHMPVKVGLLDSKGADMPLAVKSARATGSSVILELRESEQSFTFTGVSEKPCPSVLRDFSAPVNLEMDRSREELAFLMAHDSDSFSRWDAGQELARGLLLELAEDSAAGRELKLDPVFVQAFGSLLQDEQLDGSLKALALRLPTERELSLFVEVVDPVALYTAREFVRKSLAVAHRATFESIYAQLAPTGSYSNDSASIARRRLRNTALAYLAALEEPQTNALVKRQFDEADNMTDSQAALTILSNIDCAERGQALAEFFERWKEDPLVIDKWFTVQAISKLPSTFDEVLKLAEHPDFNLKNPNRVRSLLSAFAASNQLHFHRADGAGYRFIAEQVIKLNGLNPQIASRMVSSFNHWRRFGEVRQQEQIKQLEHIAAQEDLSKDVFEIVQRALKR